MPFAAPCATSRFHTRRFGWNDEPQVAQCVEGRQIEFEEGSRKLLFLGWSNEFGILAAPLSDSWSESLNARRCALIEKEIAGTLSDDERREFDELQRKAIAYRDSVAPLVIDGAIELQQRLLRKRTEISSEE